MGISPTGPQLVRLPTWLWIDPRLWTPRTTSASVPGVVVTATATPLRVSWATDDDSVVTCTGPGTPWLTPVNDPTAASPTCGHIYVRGSSSAPGGVFNGDSHGVVVSHLVGVGQGGTLPDLTTTSTTTVRVNEVQALVVRG
jgi:hypothetical protein